MFDDSSVNVLFIAILDYFDRIGLIPDGSRKVLHYRSRAN